MRAISLSVKAFGPYWGQQTVNFNELGEESIFLITGPTGAGKTTIFDAICYALYGRASGSDRDQDSLRSHFATMDDQTEVQFHFALNQKEYVVTRSPKQYKKKERGEGYTDDPPKAILYEIKNGEKLLLYSRIKEVNETLEGKLGFDYEQFRKMILIPQGEFRKLISENSKEREAVLQNIFHTYFYERMTDQLKTESRTLKDKIAFIEQSIEQELRKIDWTNTVPEEADTIPIILKKLTDEITETKKLDANESIKKSEQQKVVQKMQQALQDGKLLEEKYKQKEKLELEQKELKEREISITETKEKIKAATSASKVFPFEEQMKARKKEWMDEEEGLQKQQDLVSRLQNKYETISASYNDQLQQEDTRNQLKEAISKEKQQLEYVNLYANLQKETMEIAKERNELNKKLTNTENNIVDIDRDLDKADAMLESEQEVTKQYYDMKEKCEQASTIINELKSFDTENKKLNTLRKNYKQIEITFQRKQNELRSLREEYRKLEIAQKEEYAVVLAGQLEHGKPCPVCGSVEHPFKAASPDHSVDTNLMETTEQKLHQQERAVEEFQKTYVDSKSEGQSQRLLVDKLEEEIKGKITNFDQIDNDRTINEWNERYKKILEKRDILYKQISKIQSIKTNKTALKAKKEKVKQTFDQFSKNYQTIHEKLVKYETRLIELKKNIPDHVTDPIKFQMEISNKEQAYNKLINTWEKLKKDYQDTREKMQKEKTILEEKQKTKKRANDNYTKQENLFTQQVESCGFSSIEKYQLASLTEGEQYTLEKKVEAYEKRLEELTYTLKTLVQDIQEKGRPDILKLENELHVKQTELDQISEQLQLLRIKMKSDEQIHQSISNQLEKQQELEKDFYTIGDLADLAHGNNSLKLSFERYVLASFLDEIILQANLRLDRMSDHRYQLIRSGQVAKRGAQSGLDLEVLDHHTGQQRSVKTLSGGEGFKASLSLALGLADVVQTHAGGIQLDTLFIDEGFGTLDEESLQQAIDCLKDLQQSNRLLGIISHVPHLKNEIHAKLQITPSHNGSKFGFQFGQI
ncbi:SbcC/MukB-like Walker B domain-containing protein [Virgibacillus necropolis]|nr:SbcC/MukB-like Walker B domain-containing protein [Virgibacillus necropolis]